MWIAFELGINFLQACMMLLFMKSRLHISKRRPYADGLCVLAVATFFALYEFVEMPVSDLAVFALPFLYALIAADDKWYVSLFWSLVLGLVFMVGVSLSLHIFMSIPQISYDDLMADTAGRVVFVLVTNLLLALLLYATAKIKKESAAPAWSALLLFVLTNAALIAVEESVFSLQMKLASDYGSIDKLPFFLVHIGVLLCTVFSILLFHMMSLSAERENRYKLEAGTMAMSRQHIQELERMYVDLCAQRHDMKQHVQTLEEMIGAGGRKEAAAYMADYKAKLTEKEFFLTGSIAVDALLTAKHLTMRKHQLQFKLTAYPLNDLPINEVDFCAIIGNLLDNAIEGTLRVQNAETVRFIHLTFSRSRDMFYIYCTNACNPQTIQKKRGRWQSSKEKEGIPGMHAIGIRNIEKIAYDAEGRWEFTVKGNVFYAKVVLPYP